MAHVMMMEIRIDVNVRRTSWAIDVNEVGDEDEFHCRSLHEIFSVEKSCSSPQCFNGGVCVNTAVSFKCICPIDYEGQRCDLSESLHSISFVAHCFLFRME